jgi:hypothetical protein
MSSSSFVETMGAIPFGNVDEDFAPDMQVLACVSPTTASGSGLASSVPARRPKCQPLPQKGSAKRAKKVQQLKKHCSDEAVLSEESGGEEPGQDAQEQLCRGPGVLQDLFKWPFTYLLKLQENNLADQFLANLKQGIDLETDYSGAGTMEAVADTMNGLARHTEFFIDEQPLQPEQGCKTLRSCDNNDLCQHVLRSAVGVAAPMCVFNDITDRLDSDTLNTMRNVEAEHQKQMDALFAPHQLSASMTLKEAKTVDNELPKKMNNVVSAMMTAMITIMTATTFDLAKTVFCSKHDRLCPLISRQRRPGALTVWAGGVSCLDWTAMGKRSAWSGEGCIATLIWLFYALARKPHVLIIECTPNFDMKFVKRILEPVYNVMYRKLCPTMLGVPSRRLRIWAVCVLAEGIKLQYRFDSDKFDEMFFQKLTTDSSVFLSSHDDDREKVKQAMALRNKMPETDFGGIAWPLTRVMNVGPALRLKGYTYIKNNSIRCSSSSTILCDWNQNPDEICAMGINVAPPLLRCSNLAALQINGTSRVDDDPLIVLAKEHMTIMGWPPHADSPVHHSFQHLVDKLSHKQIKSLMGNAMHMQVAGATLMYVLSAVTFQEPAVNHA